MMKIPTNNMIFHFESLIKESKAFKRSSYSTIANAVQWNGNSALAVIHPGFCREIVKDRIEHSVYPPIVFDTIEPAFVFSEYHFSDKTLRWLTKLNPKSPVILVETWIGMPVPLDGWASFIKPCQSLNIKSFNETGEMAIKINNESCGCPSIFYDNINGHFKVNLLTDYTFPNLSFQIPESDL
jgi:hypothetical protein